MVPLIGIAVPLVLMTVVTGCEFGKKSSPLVISEAM
jgi:hypothetical protein